ncbi:MAG: hypothetical protein JWN40_988 [Phycisphaerales bacterium]|nr:hypothetical protein [Phycisphaerales bacterium]
MPRRRLYILNIEDYLDDDIVAPPSRLRPALRRCAAAIALLGFGVALVQFVASLLPSETAQTALPVTIAYALVLLLFVALAKRLNHIE